MDIKLITARAKCLANQVLCFYNSDPRIEESAKVERVDGENVYFKNYDPPSMPLQDVIIGLLTQDIWIE